MSTFNPSKYQQNIFDFIQNGRGDGIVNAVSGSGKTTTLVEASKLLQTKNSLFCAYNKHIADTLASRLQGMECRTLHSLGYGALASGLGKIRMDKWKYNELYKESMTRIIPVIKKKTKDLNESEASIKAKVKKALTDLVHFSQVSLSDWTDEEELQGLMLYYGIDCDYTIFPYVFPEIDYIMKRSIQIAEERKEISFNDMVWLPHQLGLYPKKYQWIFVDECQDLNTAQLELIFKARAKGGRMIFVGDPNQSIYGFSGANPNSFYGIKEKTQATELPLSVCYRCPTSHVELAQDLVPQIEPADNSPEGILKYISQNEMENMIREGDMIMCRITAPLIELCIKLISRKIPARVKGRDIGTGLTTIVKEIAEMSGYHWKKFIVKLDEYCYNKIRKLEQKKNSEGQIESFKDRIEGIRICYESFNCNDAEHLCKEIENLFSEDRASVTLCTVHRAKGLENERCFIYKPEKLPLIWKNQLEWQKQQELNCQYVAYTRAKKELYFVSNNIVEKDYQDSEILKNSLN